MFADLCRPELLDARRRLRQVLTLDGSTFFTTLYRLWCHNVCSRIYDNGLFTNHQAVATFSLCLLAQAYEHASNLLQVFAELEITVDILLQIDRLYRCYRFLRLGLT